MTTRRSLIVLLVLVSCAFVTHGRSRGSAKVLGDRMVDQRSTGTTVGNVIINVPIPSAPPSPTSRSPLPGPSTRQNPAASRFVIVEIGDIVYEWEQVKGPRFPATPDDIIEFTENKGKYTVSRGSAVYEFIVAGFQRK